MRTVLTGAPLYLAYFGLHEAPFSTTPDPRFLYLSERHRDAFAHLLYGVADRGGFVQLTGEVGTGKTTLCRHLLDHLPEGVDVALILNPMLSRLELLATICDELRVPYEASTESIKTLVDALYAHLLDAHAHGRRSVVIVDEAQHLSGEVLEQLRLLTNLETGKAKLLQIILIGQPELIARLAHADLRQVAQRVAARYHLEPLDEAETRAYVLHRTSMAGQPAVLFQDRALRVLHHASRGLPRLLNVLCDRALLGAYATGGSQVTTAIARRAVREVSGTSKRSGVASRRVAFVTAGAVAIAAVASAIAVATPVARWTRGADVAPVASAPAVAAAPPAIAAPPPPPRVALKHLLDDATVATDAHAAYARVAARWGMPYDARAKESPCDTARRHGLQCLARRGTWSLVAQFDLTAVLEIVGASGATQFLAVTAVDKDEVTVDVGTRREVLALDDVQQEWQGGFVVLWKPPVAGVEPIGPGATNAAVVWLRKSLATLDGTPVTTPESRVYDDRLAARVLAFQRTHRLTGDGIAGAETLAVLSALVDPSTPSLRRQGSRS